MEPTILIAAKWKAAHRVSFVDTAIAACAKRHKVALLHKDPEFEVLQDQREMEALPYTPRKREAASSDLPRKMSRWQRKIYEQEEKTASPDKPKEENP